MNQLITKFYNLSEALDDDYDMIVLFMLKFSKCRLKKSKLRRYIENANYSAIEQEIEDALRNIDKAHTFKLRSVKVNLFNFME